MRLMDLEVGEQGMLVENIGDEQRWTVYQRREGSVVYPNNVPVFRIRCLQGVLGYPPRYLREGSSLYPSEAHKSTPVEPLREWPVAMQATHADTTCLTCGRQLLPTE
jgi:hypothetical protein